MRPLCYKCLPLLHCNINYPAYLHCCNVNDWIFPVSRQLALSAAFSVFAMAAFALFATPEGMAIAGANETGAKAIASAPVIEKAFAALPFIAG